LILSKFSNFHKRKTTVLVFAIALIVLSLTTAGLARELRVTTAEDLRNCTKGEELLSGPNAGESANAGDSCVVLPGTYDVGGDPVNITVENLTLRSTDGATATIIMGNVPTSLNNANPANNVGGLINVIERGVTVGGSSSDQGFTVSNLGNNSSGVGILVTDPTAVGLISNSCCPGAGTAATGDITIQNNTVQNNVNEGILFYYSRETSIDTVSIKDNTISDNGGDGISFAYDANQGKGVSAIGRQGFDRNVVIENNEISRNASGSNLFNNQSAANVHFYNGTTIEQLAIVNNKIMYGGTQGSPQNYKPADGILFDVYGNGSGGLNELRDSLISNNLVQYNSRNGIKFNYNGRLGENVMIKDNRGASPDQGITHNGPSDISGGAEGNGIYVTENISEVRGVEIIDNAINSNRGYGGSGDSPMPPMPDQEQVAAVPCRNGNGLAIEADGRVEALTLKENDFRLNLNDGVCIANVGDFTRSTVSGNYFRSNGAGDYITQVTEAPYGNGMGVYHDGNITRTRANTGYRVEEITFTNNEYRENGGDNLSGQETSGLGFGLFIRTQQGEVSGLSFVDEEFERNYLGGARIDTDNGDSGNVRSGDVRDIEIKNVTASESQGNSNLESFDGNMKDNGDGFTILTDTGEISNVHVNSVNMNNNGGFGLRIESDGTAEWSDEDPDQAGDISDLMITNSNFNYNGTRAAIGRGSGVLAFGYSVHGVTVGVDQNGNEAPVEVSHNNDHGLQVTGTRTASDILIRNVTARSNDRNSDTIGDGIQVNANEDLSQVVVEECIANGAYGGIRIGVVGRQIAQSLTVKDNEAKNNRNEGIALFAGRDLVEATASGNILEGNGTGIAVQVRRMGSNISVKNNEVIGDRDSVGFLLDANDVVVTSNKFARNDIGVKVLRAEDNSINQNNITRNRGYGMDATALNPGEVIDAENNWWGESSGPYHPTKNPNGLGNEVTDKVDFEPFSTRPVVATNSNFEILSFSAPSTAEVGTEITITVRVKNTGPEPGAQTVTLEVAGHTIKHVSETLNPGVETTITFEYTFSEGGDYTIKVTTDDDEDSQDISVSGGPAPPSEEPTWSNCGFEPPIDGDQAVITIDVAVSSGTVTIFDISGKQVKQVDFSSNSAEIDLSGLDNGPYLYIIEVTGAENGDNWTSPVKKFVMDRE